MTTAFDLRTLLFVGGMAALVCSGMLWASRSVHAPSRDALRWTALSQLSFGIGMLLLSLRGIVPDVLSVQVANTVVTTSGVVCYEGVRRIVGARPMPWLVAVAAALLGTVFFAIGEGMEWLTFRLQLNALVSAAAAGASLPLVYSRMRSEAEPAGPTRWGFTFLAALCAGHLLRFVITLAGVTPSPTGQVDRVATMVLPTLLVLSPLAYALILIGLVNGRLASELWKLATVDTLTGVRTRRSFIEQARLTMSTGAGGAVLLMLDLDRFKQINDRFGHASGDRVLVHFARLLRQTFPDDAVIGRYGGEEFCLLMPGTSAGDGLALAQRLCDTVRATGFGLATPDTTVTVSIGLAASSDGETLEELLLAADRRLYLAKSAGRDRVVINDRVFAVDGELLAVSAIVPPPVPARPAAVTQPA